MSAALRWLTSPEVIRDCGGVLAWHNPVHPGYLYPEAAGLLLRYLTDQELTAEQTQQRARIATRLGRQVAADDIGRGPHRYTFDLGVVLAGLRSFALLDEGAVAAFATLAQRVRDGVVVRPGLTERWSTHKCSPHLLKLAIGALLAPPSPTADGMLRHLAGWPTQCEGGGRLLTPPHSTTYVHAHAYATEGLLALAGSTAVSQDARARSRKLAHVATAWLVEAQHKSGGIWAWHDGMRGSGARHSDATAQAIRLWCLVDRDYFARPITDALGFLSRMTTGQGAVRYSDQSDDLNTWATIFAEDAKQFVQQPGRSVRQLY